MAKVFSGALRRTGDMNIPTPNKALEAWLVSDSCRKSVHIVASRIAQIYVNSLPTSKVGDHKPMSFGDNAGPGKRNLRRHVKVQEAIMSDTGTPRWHAWVINTALSYRHTQGQPYAAFIEYKYSGGGQLRAAAELAASMLNIDPVSGFNIIAEQEEGFRKQLAARRAAAEQARRRKPPEQMSLAERMAEQKRQRQGRGYGSADRRK